MTTAKRLGAILGGLLAIASCSIICGCDGVKTAEEITPRDIADNCLLVGGLFGPCAPGNTCSPGLTCMSLSEGDMCRPTSDVADDPAVVACAEMIGAGLQCNTAPGGCWLICNPDIPGECDAGTVCDNEEWECVHPPSPAGRCAGPGELFGPCINNECSGDLACFTAKIGDMCVPIYTGAPGPADDWNVNMCAGEIGSLSCLDALGFCIVKCDNGNTCDSGATCDEWIHSCVWSDG